MDKKYINPPPLADRFLSWYCSEERFEEIQGDLHELFNERLEQYSVTKAKILYCWDVMRCFKGYARKSRSKNSMNSRAMFKNYFLIASRNLIRNKTYAAINIFGLALGIVCFTFIFKYVDHELSYDQFHSKKDKIYTVPFTWHFGVTELPTARATSNVGHILKENFSEVLEFLRFKSPGKIVVKSSLVLSEERMIFFSDSTFFKFFSFELIEGNPDVALVEPYSIVITETLALKYFGQDWRATSVLGRPLNLDGKEYEVTGLIALPPNNSHIKFEGLASFSTLPESQGNGNFDNSSYNTYVLLEDNVNVSALDLKIDEYLANEFKGGETFVTLDLRSLSDIYLKSHLSTGLGPMSDIKYVYVFSIIGLVIIVIACINYMNLATARSVERAKEVGVRKVMGAYRAQLSIQFISESFLITFFAIITSLLAMVVLLPMFNNLTGKSFEIQELYNFDLMVLLVCLWFAVSLLAGAYPAIMLSGLRIARILKGSFKNSSSGTLLRKVLVVLQFSISATLIIGTAVVYQQLGFIQSQNLGFDQDRVLSIPLAKSAKDKLDYIKFELLSHPQVRSAAATMQLPGDIAFETTFAVKTGEENRQLMRAVPADLGYVETLSLDVLEGEDFSSEAPKEEYQILINQQTAAFFGWTDREAVGKKLMFWGEWGTIKGVVKDFHFASLHEKIKPLVIFYSPEEYFMHRKILLKLAGNDMASTLQFIESKWVELFPEEPFSYSFLDDQFGDLYAKEQRLSEMFSVFAVIAVLIGCLGLFGLASYTASQRSKEIGIRKVLGASITSIAVLLSKSFTGQVIISLLLSLPLGYYLMDQWLESFAYRIQISWLILALSAAIVVLIAWFTVGYKSVVAALTNPVDTLKNE